VEDTAEWAEEAEWVEAEEEADGRMEEEEAKMGETKMAAAAVTVKIT
jgi:hypothetical protein